MYESMFRNVNGTLGVVAGPHPSIKNGWETMGQVAYFYIVTPDSVLNLERPNCDDCTPPITSVCENTRSSPNNQINVAEITGTKSKKRNRKRPKRKKQ